MLSFVWPGANSVGWIWGESVGVGEKNQGDLFNRCDPRGPLPGTVSCPLGFLLFSNNSDCTSGKILKRICEEKAMCYFFFSLSKHILTRDTICVLLDLIWEKKKKEAIVFQVWGISSSRAWERSAADPLQFANLDVFNGELRAPSPSR